MFVLLLLLLLLLSFQRQYMIKDIDGLHGGLQKVADDVGCDRIGPMHQVSGRRTARSEEQQHNPDFATPNTQQ
jgi:hypothetical protein